MSNKRSEKWKNSVRTTDVEEGIEEERKGGTMSTLLITFVAFVAVSGTGPFASEVLVRVGNPLVAILGLTIMPWFIGLPSALMTAELSSSMPDNRGYLLWVQKAFGYFWAFQQGALQAICGIVDLAIYPVLFTEYLAELYPMSQFAMRLIQIIIVCISATFDILGVAWIGNLSMLLSAFVMLPFLLITVIGFPLVSVSDWLILPDGSFFSIEWSLFITIMAFKFTGFDAMSHFAGDMKYPSSYSFSMVGALLLSILARVIPMLVMVCTDKNYSIYSEGYYTVIALKVGGVFLSSMVVLSAAVGCFVTHVTYLYSSSVTLWTLSGKDYLDVPILHSMSRFNTPWMSILFVAVTSSVFSILSFEELVKLSGSLYQICLLMQYAALLKLRITKPNLPRPNKIPFGIKGLIIFLIPPVVISLFILISIATNSLSASCVLLGSIVISVGLYHLKSWFHFHKLAIL